tara:strand:+ start:495 stop:794 length:300 start_codon:yes stop_codon:yes gene_type:complete
MVKPEDLPCVRFVDCPIDQVMEWLSIYDWESCVGHRDTATIFSNLLGIDVEHRRTSVTLSRGDSMVVGQYKGPRLEEGATALPEDSEIQWVYVEILESE